MVGTKGIIYPQYMYLTSFVFWMTVERYIKRAMGASKTRLPTWLATLESLKKVEIAIDLKIIVKP